MSEPKRCECGECWFGGGGWWWKDKVCVANSTLSGYCPDCGCRLSVEAGEPRVGEKYADLERDAKRFRAVADDVQQIERIPCDVGDIFSRWSFETSRIYTRYDTLGEYADALGGETDTETGEVEVGPSEAKLLAALQGMIGVVGGCPKVCLPRVGCPANSPAPPPGEACRVDNDNGWQPCWLLHYGLATTYADAQALWERMEEAAKSDE